MTLWALVGPGAELASEAGGRPRLDLVVRWGVRWRWLQYPTWLSGRTDVGHVADKPACVGALIAVVVRRALVGRVVVDILQGLFRVRVAHTRLVQVGGVTGVGDRLEGR